MGWEVENWRQKIHLNFRNFHINLRQNNWNPRYTNLFFRCFKTHNMQLVLYVVFVISCCVLKYKVWKVKGQGISCFQFTLTHMIWLQVKGQGHGWLCYSDFHRTTLGDLICCLKRSHVSVVMSWRDARHFALTHLGMSQHVRWMHPNARGDDSHFQLKLLRWWCVNVWLMFVWVPGRRHCVRLKSLCAGNTTDCNWRQQDVNLHVWCVS